MSRKRGLTAESQEAVVEPAQNGTCPNCQNGSKPGSPVLDHTTQRKGQGEATATVNGHLEGEGEEGRTMEGCDGVGSIEDGLRTLSLEGRKSPAGEGCVNGSAECTGRNNSPTGAAQEDRKSSSSPDPTKSPKSTKPNLSEYLSML